MLGLRRVFATWSGAGVLVAGAALAPRAAPAQPTDTGAPQPTWTAPPGATQQVVVVAPQEDPESGRPMRLDYSPGEVIPQGYVDASEPNRGLLLGGVVTFAVPYLVSFLTGALVTAAGEPRTAPLMAPVVGPFIAIGTLGASKSGAFYLALDGVLQTAGLTCAFVSIGVRQHHLQRVGSAPSDVRIGLAPAAARVEVTF